MELPSLRLVTRQQRREVKMNNNRNLQISSSKTTYCATNFSVNAHVGTKNMRNSQNTAQTLVLTQTRHVMPKDRQSTQLFLAMHSKPYYHIKFIQRVRQPGFWGKTQNEDFLKMTQTKAQKFWRRPRLDLAPHDKLQTSCMGREPSHPWPLVIRRVRGELSGHGKTGMFTEVLWKYVMRSMLSVVRARSSHLVSVSESHSCNACQEIKAASQTLVQWHRRQRAPPLLARPTGVWQAPSAVSCLVAGGTSCCRCGAFVSSLSEHVSPEQSGGVPLAGLGPRIDLQPVVCSGSSFAARVDVESRSWRGAPRVAQFFPPRQ